MKKKIAVVLAGIMMVCALAGCGKAKSKYLLDVDYSDYVQLCEYKNLEVDKVVFDVSDDEVMEQIDMQMWEYAEYKTITDRGIEMGDNVVLDYQAKLEGIDSEDYSGEEEEILVGEGFFYPEAEEAIIGMKAGEKKKVELTLTEDFAEEGDEGKKLSLDITIDEVTEEHLPEYNDAFVKKNTEYASVEEYNEATRKEIMESKEDEYKNSAVSDIMEYVVNNSTFDGYPEELYTQCEEYFDAEMENSAAMYGMEVEELLDLFGYDEESKKESILENVHYELVIGAVAYAEGIDCTTDEIKKYVEDNFEDFGYESSEEFFKDYTEEDVGYQLVYEKVVDFLYDNAKYVEIDEDTYLKQQEEEMAEEYEEYGEEEGTVEEEDAESESDGGEEESSGEEEAEQTEEEASEE
ncbi:MAG: FKBP-type peptidyl-prolyl cis-trans isomerase [Clostridium sp.]|nr:FKBP-type peptidyl-prolyl cis-trans isomerase [Clostridium sp.]